MGDPGAGADRDHAWCWCPGQKEGADLILIGASRSRTCCRHFLLAQLGDGRHVVLGEESAHARLQDLLLHYTACPLSPYGETLSEPLARQVPIPTPARTLALTPGTQARAPLLPPHAELRPQDLARHFPIPTEDADIPFPHISAGCPSRKMRAGGGVLEKPAQSHKDWRGWEWSARPRSHLFLWLYFGLAAGLEGSWFPDRGLKSAVKAPSPNHWATREFPGPFVF